jgi:NAD(P)-dependent dehydrogenase (short-subunit alcohol dehydrogenase family)
MSKPFSGKIALVTGGGSGIGHASALAYARAGATVVVADLVAERCDAVVAEILRADGQAVAQACDVSQLAQIDALFDFIAERFGRLDVAFNNAGIGGPVGLLADFPDESWDQVMNTNLASVFRCMKREIPLMLASGGGAIVNCASVAGHVGMRNMPVYTASKHGILGLTKSAALDYAPQGVRINAVCPGVIHTPAVDAWKAADPVGAGQFMDAMVAAEPIGRLGTPTEVAEAVLWLSSPQSSFVVGSGLVVDGGYIAQ